MKGLLAVLLAFVFVATPVTTGHAVPHDHGEHPHAGARDAGHRDMPCGAAHCERESANPCCVAMSGHCASVLAMPIGGSSLWLALSGLPWSPADALDWRGLTPEAEPPPPKVRG